MRQKAGIPVSDQDAVAVSDRAPKAGGGSAAKGATKHDGACAVRGSVMSGVFGNTVTQGSKAAPNTGGIPLSQHCHSRGRRIQSANCRFGKLRMIRCTVVQDDSHGAGKEGTSRPSCGADDRHLGPPNDPVGICGWFRSGQPSASAPNLPANRVFAEHLLHSR